MKEANKFAKYSAEMERSKEGAINFLKRSLNGQEVSNDQIINVFEYFGAKMKLEIENKHYLSQEEKEHKIQKIEADINDLRLLLYN